MDDKGQITFAVPWSDIADVSTRIEAAKTTMGHIMGVTHPTAVFICRAMELHGIKCST